MQTQIHEAAAKGFQTAPDAYERGRPEYPIEALNHFIEVLGLRTGMKVVDIGAGTGKFTKLLQQSGAALIGVEPVEGMRKKFASVLPGVEILDGTAESIPLPDSSVDVVIAAQAFHWFNGSQALKEIHRILKPSGKLGMIWNARDESIDWVGKLTDMIDPHEKGAPRYKSGVWRQAFDKQSIFTPLEYTHFKHVQSGPPEMIVDRVTSISFIAALPDQVKEQVVNQVKSLLTTHSQLTGRGTIELPYRTDLFWCSKK